MTTPADTIRATAETFHREHGTSIETLEHKLTLAQLAYTVDRNITREQFEEILDVLERQYQAKDTNSWLPDGDRAHDLNLIEQELTAAIDRAA